MDKRRVRFDNRGLFRLAGFVEKTRLLSALEKRPFCFRDEHSLRGRLALDLRALE